MKKLLSLVIILLLVVFTFVACLPKAPSDTDTEARDSSASSDDIVSDTDADIDTDSDSYADTDSDSDSDSDTDTDTDTDTGTDTDTDTDTSTDTNIDTDTDADAPSEDKEPVIQEITISKSANEIASIIGKQNNGDNVGDTEIALDENISVTFGKGSANTSPALYSGAIRIYQNGGTLTINAKNGSVIKEVSIVASDNKTGNGKLTISSGWELSTLGDIITATPSGDLSALTITVGGSTKSDRLYVSSIEVVYMSQGGTADKPNTDGGSQGGDSGNQGGEGGDGGDYLFYDFTEDEKLLYNDIIGFVIPFLPTDDYMLEDYNEDGYEGIYYSALCEMETAFNWYLAMFSSYENDGTDVDEDGNTVYLFSKNGIYIDIYYYEYESSYYVDVDAYLESSSSGDGGDISDESVITNEGAGLPQDDGDGIYDISFKNADKVKDVTDQGSYIDGCPTVGSPGVLVIPVEFSDRTASSLGYSIDNIKSAFEKDGDVAYYSVYDYYYISSLGQLTLDITVADNWFRPSKPSTYYASYTTNIDGETIFIGDQLVMDEALAYLDDTMDLSKFDSDNNGIIDAVVLVSTLKINEETDFYWAYRYWNYYTDSDDYYYEYDGVSANDYLWASYEFLQEDTDLSGDYSNTSIINTYTFIHEFGHILGADDYYDTAYEGSPLDGYDIMDSKMGDHNAYTKFNLGWITSSRLVVTDTEITLTLEDFSENGDTIILTNSFDPDLGVYQEYYILVYYTDSQLNSGIGGYFDESGIVVYHVNASLYSYEYNGEIYYDVYNNNTDAQSQYGTVNNLIELVSNGEDYVYSEGDTMISVTDDLGASLGYTFTVIDLTDTEATIKVSAK